MAERAEIEAARNILQDKWDTLIPYDLVRESLEAAERVRNTRPSPQMSGTMIDEARVPRRIVDHQAEFCGHSGVRLDPPRDPAATHMALNPQT